MAKDSEKPDNPMEAYLATKTAGMGKNAARDQNHMELWQQWKQDPQPYKLQPLLHELQPTLNKAVRDWKAPNTNETAFRAELTSRTIKALEKYDPSYGASITTHVTNYIQKAKRFNSKAQNMAYIPEEKAKYIGKIDAAKDELYDDFGREPTHIEIGNAIGLKPSLVKEIQGLRRADVRGSAFQSDPLGHTGSRDQEVVALLRAELKPDEQEVYDFVYGQNGKPKVESTGEIARRLGKSPSQVSRIKNRIGAAYKKYV